MILTSIHLKGTGNVGDEMASPAHYFPFDARIDMADPYPDGVLVFGGGCIDIHAAKKARKLDQPCIAWGIGQTTPLDWERMVIDYGAFDLAGSRDYPPQAGVDWVPCPSCMSPLLDNPPAPTRKTVEYGHAKLHPMAVNNDAASMAEVIAYLASAEEIITASYHGMVWGTLLGRKVRVIKTGRKFDYWPFAEGVHHPDALKVCREANLAFWEKLCRTYGLASRLAPH